MLEHRFSVSWWVKSLKKTILRKFSPEYDPGYGRVDRIINYKLIPRLVPERVLCLRSINSVYILIGGDRCWSVHEKCQFSMISGQFSPGNGLVGPWWPEIQPRNSWKTFSHSISCVPSPWIVLKYRFSVFMMGQITQKDNFGQNWPRKWPPWCPGGGNYKLQTDVKVSTCRYQVPEVNK